ncbi:type IV secretion system DNA-binding domain-containing protein [Geotalea sp. SG265]|uniref:type IV secretion system DNA-binding domain-containing protein n=1 Tax=Geotalea sp. SG265 TaxID=2922867 RepID=UPI001FAFE304|nr:type IV secretion system DNA-binding domain-containing protein [Geotalea sp. SG265]
MKDQIKKNGMTVNLEPIEGKEGIILDYKSDYIANVFEGITCKEDIVKTVNTIIPKGQGDNWNDAANAVFADILTALYEKGRITKTAVKDVITGFTAGEIATLVKGVDGGKGYAFIRDHSSKQTGVVLGVLAVYTAKFW